MAMVESRSSLSVEKGEDKLEQESGKGKVITGQPLMETEWGDCVVRWVLYLLPLMLGVTALLTLFDVANQPPLSQHSIAAAVVDGLLIASAVISLGLFLASAGSRLYGLLRGSAKHAGHMTADSVEIESFAGDTDATVFSSGSPTPSSRLLRARAAFMPSPAIRFMLSSIMSVLQVFAFILYTVALCIGFTLYASEEGLLREWAVLLAPMYMIPPMYTLGACIALYEDLKRWRSLRAESVSAVHGGLHV